VEVEVEPELKALDQDKVPHKDAVGNMDGGKVGMQQQGSLEEDVSEEVP